MTHAVGKAGVFREKTVPGKKKGKKLMRRHLTPRGIVRGRDEFLYGEKLKAYLLRGARQLQAVREYPNPQLGWGVLCLRDSLSE